MNIRNLYSRPDLVSGGNEIFERLAEGNDVVIERIISAGHITPENEWYDQDRDEWAVLVRGTAAILFENGEQIHLTEGDAIVIPAHRKHRVVFTSSDPPCIWLAVHAEMRAC
jgi:cupin 2 domain-containing protein